MSQKTLRVLQLGKFFPIKGGVEKVAYDLTTGLSEQGIYCDMMCAVIHGHNQQIPLNENAKIIGCHTWLKLAATMISPAMIWTLRKRCKQYDIIHVHHPDPMACLALFLSGYKGKVVLHWHSDILQQKTLLAFYKPLQKWLIRRAEKIIGTTPVYLSESPFLQRVQNKTVCLPIGVERMRFEKEDAEKLKSEYPGKKIVFSLGRLVTYKGYDSLIDAAQYLSDDYVVLIGGTGRLENRLQKRIEILGIQSKVKLLGHIDKEKLSAYYGACDVFCLSSIQKTEAFGIVQIEAMSCGKPVVATRIPGSGVSWVNTHGVSGLNVTPGNAPQLAEAIRNITENEAVYRKYSEGASQRYQELFTRERMIKGCLHIYREIL